MSTKILILVLAVAFVAQVKCSIDLTREPRTSGEDVVKTAVLIIEDSFVFEDDNNFLVRSAYVQSKYGVDRGTYRPDFFGGIWQVSEANFLVTQNKIFEQTFTKILYKFQIDWTNVIWMDLEKPLYSALAFRIFLDSIVLPIPKSIEEQGKYWSSFVNPSSTSKEFEQKIRPHEAEPSKCIGRMNLIILLDGSASIGYSEFQKAKVTVSKIVSTFSPTATKTGLIVFSSTATTIIPLDNQLTSDQLSNKILSTSYPNQGTRTDLAIDLAVQELLTSNLLGTTSPRIILTITDGLSNEPDRTIKSSAEAKSKEIILMSLGVGTGISGEELQVLAGDNKAQVLKTNDYNTLPETVHLINAKVCLVPEVMKFDQPINDEILRAETRLFRSSMSNDGLTVFLENLEGRTRGFYSQPFRAPSEAIHDGILSGRTFIPSSGEKEAELFITIQGIRAVNNYTIVAMEGNLLGNATSEVIPNKNLAVTDLATCGGYTHEECTAQCAALRWTFGNCIQFVCICHH